ncbi:single-stranded DNA-binding protein WHY1, chloroplastic isoform X2 [Amborella trichopoda]|uniref:WHY domain class transcription factor n=1 Tax=Amborella trichopoda TaxID=13333 RepID=W1P9V1_AMBTC|nr:single-stranded DNA-binding protein WHY1, chloroplastic isoform X2 [Amborella trichopoda]ERN04401.1 hypothetical protein AMTR_s00133p00020030 [Amborella trichopoda]|eukprot:XP_006842726.1 single-stranded DNA-binding protein WHY1, chloroplastic isoform X2 [Amborella trichopoda]
MPQASLRLSASLSPTPVSSHQKLPPLPCLTTPLSLRLSLRLSSRLGFTRRRGFLSKDFTLKCRRPEYFEPQKFTPPADNSFNGQSSGLSGRVYVGHSIFKGKAALTIEPKAPEFTALESGACKVVKDGSILLQFAPAVGTRQYDWNRKQVFSLSVAEIGALMSLGMKDTCEFYHDPFKGRSEEGKIRKVLKVEPLPDGSGYFFNLSVSNRPLNIDDSIYIPVTKAEFAVIVSAFNFILPYLLGWHAFAESIRPVDTSQLTNANQRRGAELEWGR